VDVTGSRAAVPAFVLQELERRSGQPIARLFDLVVGSSTGGLMALLLSCPGASGSPRYSARELDEGLYGELDSITGHWSSSWITRPIRRMQPERQAASLEEWLRHRFGEAPLSAAVVRVIVCAYDTTARRVRFFDSLAAREDPSQDLPFAVVAQASLATIPFVAPVRVPDPRLKRADLLVDGSLFGANATLVALSALEHHAEDPPLLLSVGGGNRRDPLDEREWRDPKVYLPLLEAARSGLADLAAGLAETTLGRSGYIRIEPELDWRENPYDDEQGPADWARLRDIAWQLVSEREADLSALAAHLAGSRSYAPSGGHY